MRDRNFQENDWENRLLAVKMRDATMYLNDPKLGFMTHALNYKIIKNISTDFDEIKPTLTTLGDMSNVISAW